jgi:uroporphyrinogen-III decarboxylase
VAGPQREDGSRIRARFLFPALTTFDITSAEIIGSKYINWPGHNLPETATYQFVEGEYMKADEYDAYLDDCGDYLFRTYLPRIYGNLQGLKSMAPMSALGSFGGLFNTFNNPASIAALETIVKAAKQNSINFMAQFNFAARMEKLGFPSLVAFGIGMAPYDIISDYLRGLRGATLDIFQRPEKLLALEQKILDNTLKSLVPFGKMMNKPLHFLATHRGSDEFMSPKQFEKFYWPGMKKILMTMIDAGMTPFVLWEGNFDQRLEFLAELPKGKTVGLFDRTNLFKAKKVLGDRMCIAGDMPLSLLQTGTPEQVKTYAKRLIDEVGEGGGFIMAANTELDYANPELVKVWIDFTKEYGVYK